jgi:hypothetical protein
VAVGVCVAEGVAVAVGVGVPQGGVPKHRPAFTIR